MHNKRAHLEGRTIYTDTDRVMIAAGMTYRTAKYHQQVQRLETIVLGVIIAVMTLGVVGLAVWVGA